MINPYLFLLFAILLTALGQFCYKKFSLTQNRLYFYLTILLFVATPVFSFLALKGISVDVVYMFTSLTILIVLILSKTLLNEEITFRAYIGVLFITLGIIFYGY